jgi:hypothetical protein
MEDLPARALNLTDVELLEIRSMGLPTLKPVIYALNVDEIDFVYARDEASWGAQTIVRSIEFWDENDDNVSGRCTVITAQLQATVATANPTIHMEKDDFEELLSFNKLPNMIREMLAVDYRIVYSGPGVPIESSETTKAHLISRDKNTALDLSGRLHNDMQKGFFAAEVIPAETLLHFDSFAKAKEAGTVRTEGREYQLRHEDVVLIKGRDKITFIQNQHFSSL